MLKAHQIEPNHATLHEQLVRFALAVKKSTTIKPSVQSVIDQHWSALYQGRGQEQGDLEAFSAAFVTKNKDLGSVPHMVSAAIATSLIHPTDKSKAEALLFSVEQEQYQKTRSLENVVLVQKTLKSLRSSRLQEWKDKAKRWYPRASLFWS
jgi:peptide alpha-N-acetyltransferase